jgi:hypothetical protein
MDERDSLSNILSRHGGITRRPVDQSPSARLLDDYSMTRILDASLGFLAAVRTLTAVAEDVVRDRRNRLAERSAAANASPTDQHHIGNHERIPLTY